MPQLSLEDWEALRAIPLFAGLPRQSIEGIIDRARVAKRGSGAVLFLQGDPADRFYVVLDGWVKLWRETAAGEETVVGIFTRGESFAEAAIFDSGSYPVNAETVAPVRLLSVPAKPLIDAIGSDQQMALRMLASMSRHMRGLVAQLEQVQARSAAERVAVFLLRLGPDGQDTHDIELPYDKSLVAARLGMRPETFSRALLQLRKIGVEVAGSHVTVPDTGVLRRFCADEPGP